MQPHKNASLILLCTTSYDEVTCLMSSLLSDFSYSGKTVHHILLERPDVSYPNVLEEYQADKDNVILIFCGHAEDDVLLTGPKQDCSRLQGISDEEVFYSSDYFHFGPKTLAAFCSSAGKDLGPAFAEANQASFLGFSEELWLIHTASEECNSWWKKMLSGSIVKIIEDEKVDEHTIDFVRSLFEEAYNYFCSEKGRLTKEALGMRMCLRQNLSALCNY